MEAAWKEALTLHMADLQIGAALSLVRQCLDNGEDPLVVVEVCEDGLKRVGELYEQGEYYLAGLIMAGEIFRQAMEQILPYLGPGSAEPQGRVLLGTVQGDIHDMGKNLLGALLRCHGFWVQDLGVDVPAAEFLRRVQAVRPDIVGLSGLLTTSYDPMRDVVRLLRTELPPEAQPKAIIIGGATITESACRYTGADAWATDAMQGVHLCQVALKRLAPAGGAG